MRNMTSAAAETSTHVEIDGQRFLLDSDRDLVDLMAEIEEAARSEPRFVHLSDGEELVSVLVSARSRIVITVEHESRARMPDSMPIQLPADWDYHD